MVKRCGAKGKRALAPGAAGCYMIASHMDKLITESPEATVGAGRALAAGLAPGTTVALEGEVGAGKTHFVRGLVEGWGGTASATSPTFALVHEYASPRGPVYHLDLYRAGSAAEVWSAAHDELGDACGLAVIEWADRFPSLVPDGAVRVRIAHAGETKREISVSR